MRTWEQAWQQALYDERGFYRRPEGPAGHFATSAQGSAAGLLAEALLELAAREGLRRVIDVGCGRGELLTALADLTAERDPDLGLLGVDVVPRPDHLDPRIDWLASPGGADLPDLGGPRDALVLAHEWLDVVPCPIARADEDGTLREVLLDEAGAEHPGAPLTGSDAQWADRWWPGPYAPGEAVEVGRARDQALAGLTSTIGSGLLLVIDYGHLTDTRPPEGTLVGYRDGAVCPPAPDGSCDLTAHVAMDSLRLEVCTQREALRELGIDGTRPPIEQARTDPAGYLAALSRASHAGALTGPGLGDFLWGRRRITADTTR